MGKLNPSSALEAMFPQPIDCGNGVVVHPLSLAQYAILDSIDSYLVTGGKPTTIESIKSLYVVTHAPEDVYRLIDSLDEYAVKWASTLSPTMLGKINDAICEQVKKMTDVLPEAENKKKVEVAMD